MDRSNQGIQAQGCTELVQYFPHLLGSHLHNLPRLCSAKTVQYSNHNTDQSTPNISKSHIINWHLICHYLLWRPYTGSKILSTGITCLGHTGSCINFLREHRFHHICARSVSNITHKVPTFCQLAYPVLGHNWFMQQFPHRKGLQVIYNAHNNY